MPLNFLKKYSGGTPRTLAFKKNASAGLPEHLFLRKMFFKRGWTMRKKRLPRGSGLLLKNNNAMDDGSFNPNRSLEPIRTGRAMPTTAPTMAVHFARLYAVFRRQCPFGFPRCGAKCPAIPQFLPATCDGVCS